MMAKETETTNPRCLGRLQGRVHSKRGLFFISFQVVLPFIFLFKCSRDIYKWLMAPKGHLLLRGLKNIILGV